MTLNQENDDLDIASIVQNVIKNQHADTIEKQYEISFVSDLHRINDIKIQFESFMESYDLIFDANNDTITKTSPQSPRISKSLQRKLSNFYSFLLSYETHASTLSSNIELNKKILRFLCSIVKRACKDIIGLDHVPVPSLWSEIRERGCQFLGPQIQEDALRLILHALDICGHMSRKVLVLYVVLRLRECNLRASKTSIGHVVQLLYRAGCFKLEKRDQQSSLMEIKKEYSKYSSLRRQHDAQIISIALEAGIRMTPEQWSKKLFGDETHRADMQSIIDSIQSQQSLEKIVYDLFNKLESKPLDKCIHLFLNCKQDFLVYSQLDKTEARRQAIKKSKELNNVISGGSSSSNADSTSDDENDFLNESYLSDDCELSSSLTETSECPGINELHLTNDELNGYIHSCSSVLKCCFEYLLAFNESNESKKETLSVASFSTSRSSSSYQLQQITRPPPPPPLPITKTYSPQLQKQPTQFVRNQNNNHVIIAPHAHPCLFIFSTIIFNIYLISTTTTTKN